MRAEISLRFCRQPYCLAPGTAELRPAMGLRLSVFCPWPARRIAQKLHMSRTSKDIHIVSLRPCQEKFFAFNGDPAVSMPLKHTSNGTLELDHVTCPPVNSFTLNRLILTIFNETCPGSAAYSLQHTTLSMIWSILDRQQMPLRCAPGEL